MTSDSIARGWRPLALALDSSGDDIRGGGPNSTTRYTVPHSPRTPKGGDGYATKSYRQERIRVVVRERPLFPNEQDGGVVFKQHGVVSLGNKAARVSPMPNHPPHPTSPATVSVKSPSSASTSSISTKSHKSPKSPSSASTSSLSSRSSSRTARPALSHRNLTSCSAKMPKSPIDTTSPDDKSKPTERPPQTRREFCFDSSFSRDTTQLQVYEEVGKPVLQNVLDGYNGAILAYGQSGSGKTHSMIGDMCDLENAGLVPRLAAGIYECVFGHHSDGDHQPPINDGDTPSEMSPAGSSESGMRCHLDNSASALAISISEVYNDELRDLLSIDERTKRCRPVDVRETPNGELQMKGLSHRSMNSSKDVMTYLLEAERNRSVGVTDLNQHSSRSHMIVSIDLSIVDFVEAHGVSLTRIKTSKLHVVDLAGSERLGKAHSMTRRNSSGTTGWTEGVHINQSLLGLAQVMVALVEGANFIPYRNSKLTRVLKDTLGGNTRTVLLATIAPCDASLEETLQTLRYADRAKQIKNSPIHNETMQVEVSQELEYLKLELSRLKRQNLHFAITLQDLRMAADSPRQPESLERCRDGVSNGCEADVYDELRRLKAQNEAQALLLEKSDSDNRELRHELERLRCHSPEHAVRSGAADFVHTATDRCAPSGISDTDLVAMQLELVQAKSEVKKYFLQWTKVKKELWGMQQATKPLANGTHNIRATTPSSVRRIGSYSYTASDDLRTWICKDMDLTSG